MAAQRRRKNGCSHGYNYRQRNSIQSLLAAASMCEVARAGRRQMKKKASGRPSAARQELLYGVNPLLEALRAGDRVPSEIVVAEGARGERLHELIELARTRNVPVKRAPRTSRDRAVGNTHHQGVMARVSAARYVDDGDLLSSIATRVGSESEPLVVVLAGVA